LNILRRWLLAGTGVAQPGLARPELAHAGVAHAGVGHAGVGHAASPRLVQAAKKQQALAGAVARREAAADAL
jgi:hypothetical protein